jgi:hypothetical protein
MKNPLHYIQEHPHRTKQILGITNDQFQNLLAQAEMHHNELQAEIERPFLRSRSVSKRGEGFGREVPIISH